jgi:hypothetical protein
VRLALIELRQSPLDSGDFLWHKCDEDGEDLPRPTTLDQLAELMEREEFWEEGTHTILDLDTLIAASDQDHDGSLRPLADGEVREVFGTDRPTPADFIQACAGGMGSMFNERRWSGWYTVLYSRGDPEEYAFWGISGD